jgi:hypothetical protein
VWGEAHFISKAWVSMCYAAKWEHVRADKSKAVLLQLQHKQKRIVEIASADTIYVL